MFSITGALYRNTPQLTVNDNRGLVIRNVHYHRHPAMITLPVECLCKALTHR